MQNALVNTMYGLTSIVTIDCPLEIILDPLKHFFDLQTVSDTHPRPLPEPVSWLTLPPEMSLD